MDNRKKGDKFMEHKFYLNKTGMEIETGIELEVNWNRTELQLKLN